MGIPLKIWLKRLLLGSVLLLLVALGALAAFMLTFNPNTYKPQLEAFVQERYQRTLSIDGDITLSVFPRIGLTLDEVSISDRNSAKRFASVGHAKLAVALWPLLFRHVVVDYISVTDLKTWVHRDAQGRFNFDDLVYVPTPGTSVPDRVSQGGATAWAAPPAATPEPGAQTWRAGLQVDIAGLELNGGEVYFDDRYRRISGRIHHLKLSTGRMAEGQPFDVNVQGRLEGSQPLAEASFKGQGRVNINPLRQHYAIEQGRFGLQGQVGALENANLSVQGSGAWNTYLQTVGLSGVQASATGELTAPQPVGELDITLSMPAWSLDRSQAALRVSGLELRATGVADNAGFELDVSAPALEVSPDRAGGEPVSGTFKQQFDQAVLGVTTRFDELAGNAYDVRFRKADVEAVYQRGDRKLSLDMSSPLRWQVFRQRADLSALKGDVNIQDATLPDADVSLPFIGSLSLDAWEKTLKSDIKAVIDGGSVELALEADRAANPMVRFDLMADSLNLNALLPESAVPVRRADPADEPRKDARTHSSDSDSRSPAFRINWAWLTGLDFEGGVAVDRLRVKDATFDRVRAGVRAREGQLRFNDIKTDLYAGTGTGHLFIGPHEAVQAGFEIEEANLGALLRALWGRPWVSGQGSMQGYFMSQGATLPALVAGLNGQLEARAAHGTFAGVDVVRTIDEADNVLRNAFSDQLPDMQHEYDSARRTAFDHWHSRTSFANGQGLIEQFDLTGPGLVVRAAQPARLDLVNRQLELLLVAQADTDASMPQARLRGQHIPILFGGSLGRPDYSVQWRDIHDPVVDEALENGLLDKLAESAGGAPGFLRLMAPEPSPDDSASDAADPIKRVGDALKGLLQK